MAKKQRTYVVAKFRWSHDNNKTPDTVVGVVAVVKGYAAAEKLVNRFNAKIGIDSSSGGFSMEGRAYCYMFNDIEDMGTYPTSPSIYG